MNTNLTTRKRGRGAVADRARIMRRDYGLCQSCAERGHIKQAVEVDHILALCNGGSDADDNKRALCDDCHKDKTRSDLGQKPKAACDVNGLPIGKHHWNT